MTETDAPLSSFPLTLIARFPEPLLCVVLGYLSLRRVLASTLDIALLFLPLAAFFITLILRRRLGQVTATPRSLFIAFGISSAAALTCALPPTLSVTAAFFLLPGLALLALFFPDCGQGADRGRWARSSLSHLVTLLSAVAIAGSIGAAALLIQMGSMYLFSIANGNRASVEIVAAALGIVLPLSLLILLLHASKQSGAPLPRLLNILLIFTYLPPLLVYGGILHGYLISIILSKTLPRGGVAFQVSLWGGFATGALVAVEALIESALARKALQRGLLLLLVLPTAMLFVAATVRIQRYGVTEERYALLLCGTWFSLAILSLLLSRFRALPWIPCAGGVLLVLGSFGPWGAEAVSVRSQTARIRRILSTGNLLSANGTATAGISSSPLKTHKALSSYVSYVHSRGRYDAVEAILSPWVSAEQSKQLPPSHIATMAHFIFVKDWETGNTVTRAFHPCEMGSRQETAADVRATLLPYDLDSQTTTVRSGGHTYMVTYEFRGNALSVSVEGVGTLSFPLRPPSLEAINSYICGAEQSFIMEANDAEGHLCGKSTWNR